MTKKQKRRRHQQTRQEQQGRHRHRRKEYERKRNRQKQERCRLVFRLQKTISHHFPDLYERMRTIPECRQEPDSRLVEILRAGLALFLLKKRSRNGMNNEREDPDFRKNYHRLFKVRLPHMDTVTDVLEVFAEEELERLKAELVKCLLAKKVLRKYRLLDQDYRVAIDGTPVMTVAEGHCAHCLHRKLKNGESTYFHPVLEAKLVCPNGFCLSLATEWGENPEAYDKQDCELKGFKRLAAKLKRYYPRLPMCLVAHSLYPNAPFFQICQDNDWHWIVTFKQGTLPSVWSEVLLQQGRKRCRSRSKEFEAHGQPVRQTYHWEAGLSYQAVTVQWFSCTELTDGAITAFTYLSSLEVHYHMVIELTASGRMRWKIENEGFNIQKHHGYGLGHQFSRGSMLAMKNYYQLMQIAHMSNQLLEFSTWFQALCTGHMTVRHLWDCLVGSLREAALEFSLLTALSARRLQFRYD